MLAPSSSYNAQNALIASASSASEGTAGAGSVSAGAVVDVVVVSRVEVVVVSACVVEEAVVASLPDEEHADAESVTVAAARSGMMRRMTKEGGVDGRNATWLMHKCWRRWRLGVCRIVQSRVVTVARINLERPVTAT
ncbi:MAG: hypothetical protein R2710_22545 [Acidimicrobiales bacterium]